MPEKLKEGVYYDMDRNTILLVCSTYPFTQLLKFEIGWVVIFKSTVEIIKRDCVYIGEFE